MDFALLDDNTRRKMIIDYVNNHELCTREEIVKSNEVPISRAKIFNLVKELLTECVLVEIRERINSRDHKLVVNKTSILFSIPQELENTKNAYLNLIRNFKGLIENERPIFPERTDEIFDSRSYINGLHGMYFELTKASSNIPIWQLNKHADKDKNFHEELKTLIEKIESYLDNSINMLNEIKKDNSADPIILNCIAGAIYYVVYDHYLNQSIFSWWNTIHDKEAFKRLLVIFYGAITEMHVEVSSLFSTTKKNNSNSLEIGKFRGVDLNDYILYYILRFGLDVQMVVMLDLLSNISTKLKRPKFFRSADMLGDELNRIKEILSHIKHDSLARRNTSETINQLGSLRDNLVQIWVHATAGPD
jgi:hypothetical protein